MFGFRCSMFVLPDIENRISKTEHRTSKHKHRKTNAHLRLNRLSTWSLLFKRVFYGEI
jgi:hypothetical protein